MSKATLTGEPLERNEKQNSLLQQLAEQLAPITDSEIAAKLGTQKSNLSEVKNRKRCLTFMQELRLYDSLGYAWARQAVLAMVPDSVRDDLTVRDNQRIARNAREAGAKNRFLKLSEHISLTRCPILIILLRKGDI